jgi:hypothetical protein
MTWTYSGSPTVDSRDEVRFLIQDTDTTDQLFSDEEIDYVMSVNGTGTAAALSLARRLLTKFARFVDTSVGAVSESASQRVAQYQALIGDLELAMSASCLPSFGGVDVAANLGADQDTSQVQPAFKRNQFDNYAASKADNDVLE